MDSWSSNAHRHKRNFDEMSHTSVLSSPSPIQSQGFPSLFFSRNGSSENNPERRRLSHPHNPPQFFQRSAETMSDRTQPLRPQLLHQSSRTLTTIDLTDDPEDEVTAPPARGPARRRLPPVAIFDAPTAGTVIDLTAEDDSEMVVTGSRQLPVPLNRPQQSQQRLQGFHVYPRAESPSLFMPPVPPPQREMPRFFGQGGPFGAGFHVHPDGLGHHADAFFGGLGGARIRDGIGGALGNAFQFFQQAAPAQAMPGQMDYGRQAFEDRRPDHVVPPPAQEGFTRSLTENDIVICPSCDEELIHNKADDEETEPVVKKGRKAPTKKDREEHPYWVVKDCGHVYCNKCYQNRVPVKGSTHQASFIEGPSNSGRSKKRFCPVEGCKSDVTSKEKWVGVFL